MMACGCRTPRPSALLPRRNSLPECGAAAGASSGKVLSFIPGGGAGIRLMLACRTIEPVRGCSGAQLTNVNATAIAKFVDSAKSVAVSGIFADDQHACGINRRRSSGESATGTDVMLVDRARSPVVLRMMAPSVVVLPSSDDEGLIP